MTENHKVAEYSSIKQSEFDNIVGNNPKVLLDVYTTWCGPCKRVKPIFQELSNEYKDIKFVSIDLDQNRWIGEKYDIHAIPTFLFFKDGQVVEKKLGGMFKDGFIGMIKEKF